MRIISKSHVKSISPREIEVLLFNNTIADLILLGQVVVAYDASVKDSLMGVY